MAVIQTKDCDGLSQEGRREMELGTAPFRLCFVRNNERSEDKIGIMHMQLILFHLKYISEAESYREK